MARRVKVANEPKRKRVKSGITSNVDLKPLTPFQKYEMESIERNKAAIEQRVKDTPEVGPGVRPGYAGTPDRQVVRDDGTVEDVYLYTRGQLADLEKHDSYSLDDRPTLHPVKTYLGSEFLYGMDYELTEADMERFLSGWYCPRCLQLQRKNIKDRLSLELGEVKCWPRSREADHNVLGQSLGCNAVYPQGLYSRILNH